MQFIAGVDAHKNTHTIVFLDHVGREVATLTIETNTNGYDEALTAARRLGGEVVWGLESTGCYSSVFARKLLDSGATVFEVPGAFTKRHRKHSSRSGKSDPIDAQAIAEAVLRESERLPRFELTAEREALRMRYDQRDRLVRQRTESVNRLRAAALRLDLPEVPTCLRSAKGFRRVEELLKQVGGTDLLTHTLVEEIRYAIEDVRRLNARVKEIETQLRPLMRRLAPELLAMYGVSTVVAAGLVGHAGNLKNCRNADAFAMRAGTAPVNCSSGKHTSVRVNFGGNRELNRLLHVIALAQLRSEDHVGRTYYDRKRTEGKAHRAAVRALKRRISVVVYYRLVVVDERYNEPVDSMARAA